MAYTNSPVNSTYKTVEFDFEALPNMRDGRVSSVQRDVQIVNMYYDQISQRNQEKWWALKKREGIGTTSYSLNKITSTDRINGYYYDNDSGYIYWAVLGKVYNMDLATGTITNVFNFSVLASTNVGFVSYQLDTGQRYILVSNGTQIWYTVAGSGSATVVAAGYPTPHQPWLVTLDGYLFVVKAATADIYNSSVSGADPSTWGAGSFVDYITAEIESDYVYRIHKVKNYLIAFGGDTMEFFYDAANATGSPMARNESYTHKIGYCGSLAQHGDSVYFMGRPQGGKATIYKLDADSCQRVSNSVIDRNLQDSNFTTITEFNQFFNTGRMVTMDGHTFYVINTNDSIWALDTENGFWYLWKSTSDTTANVFLEAVWNTKDYGTLVASNSKTTMGLFSGTTYQDYGSNFTCTYQTDLIDFGTQNWKMMPRLMMKCDMPNDDGVTPSYVVVSWSDNDWNFAEGGPRSINVASSNPYITQLGRFRERSFNFTYTDNYPMRMKGIFMDINVGNI